MISQALPEKILLTGEGGKKGNHCSSNQYVLFSIRFIHERGPMARRLPPLNGLKAFEAAGRSESFTRAGEELNVTQAVSHQVKALQEILNIRLFKRERQRLCLTEPGREYLLVVRDAFDRIASRTERLAHRRGSSVLTVSTSPDFAAKWLVNRLGRFAENHPEIDLRVSATTHHVDFVARGCRRGGSPRHWQLARHERHVALPEHLFPVCSPKLACGRKRIAKAEHLLRFPLLRLDDWSNWTRLFEAAGIADPVLRGPVLNRAGMLMDAAIDGQGIALARTMLAAGDTINGRLIRPISVSVKLETAYRTVSPKAPANAPKVATFRNWMLNEANGDARRLKRLRIR
jgi:LysR family glycine cleavage system transcriptional activator